MQSTVAETYDDSFFEHLFAIEDRHFWFRARNRVIATLVRQLIAGLPPGYRVLEVGCGTGNVLQVLEQVCSQGTVIGLDQSEEGLRYARRRTGCELIAGDARSLSFDAPFDLIGLFDVAEHIPDDVQLLRDLRGLLSPAGSLIMTVPAHKSLWSYFDEGAHHCRRYEADELRQKLAGVGYSVAYLSHFMAPLYPLMWLGRRVASLRKRGSQGKASDAHNLTLDEFRVVPVVNEVLSAVLAWERPLIGRRRRLPIGGSLIAIARPTAS